MNDEMEKTATLENEIIYAAQALIENHNYTKEDVESIISDGVE
jgi:hypothetical protein